MNKKWGNRSIGIEIEKFIRIEYYNKIRINKIKKAIKKGGIQKMDKKYGILIICAAILLLCFVGTASAKTWYVDDDGGANFTRIQDAINNASVIDGDTILVYPGVYCENVVVNKLVTLKGIGHPIVDASGGGNAITLSADGITLEGFNATNSGSSWGGAGIAVISSNNNITGNTVSNSLYGIYPKSSSNNTLSNNNCSNNEVGIFLRGSNNNKLRGNVMVENGIYIKGGSLRDYTHEIDESNTVNGKPVYYWKDVKGGRIPDGAGQVMLVNCTSVVVENQNLNNASVGMDVAFSSYVTIKNNNCSNNRECGISLQSSNNNSIASNNCSKNDDAISLKDSNNNSIANNNCSSNRWCISLWNSSNNILMNNIALDNLYGIYLEDLSNNNTLTNNNASNNAFGILLRDSRGNTLTNNKMSGNDFNFGVLGSCLSHYINNIDTSNLVNGKPIYYWVKEQNKEVPRDAGFVGIVNCTNITVRDLTLKNNGVGVMLAYSNNSRIQNVKAFHNWFFGIYLWYSNNNTLMNNTASNTGNHGIYLEYSSSNKIADNTASNNVWCISLWNSSNNTITRNTAYMNNYHGILLSESSNDNLITGNNASNNYYGIHLEKNSSNNKIYLNNFMNNDDNVYSEDSTNIWNSTKRITYTYNGSTHINYLGNYWDDYKEKYPDAEEIDRSGIWNMSYSINSDNDTYPLVEPFENYFAPTENIFDTGSSKNPYPSIFGTHNGTITPNKTITVSKLYTYPCEGTGGHTGYARIWNKSGLDVNASWKGYVGDWHNIPFNKTFTLVKNKTYNYTILRFITHLSYQQQTAG
jgi:parallel beta-helix repeat protein